MNVIRFNFAVVVAGVFLSVLTVAAKDEKIPNRLIDYGRFLNDAGKVGRGGKRGGKKHSRPLFPYRVVHHRRWLSHQALCVSVTYTRTQSAADAKYLTTGGPCS